MLSYYRVKECGKKIGFHKNATTFCLSDKQFCSAFTTTFHACAVAKFEVDDDERDCDSENCNKEDFFQMRSLSDISAEFKHLR